MIVHDCIQGTPEWRAVRLGLPTSSRFDSIVTPSKLEYSRSSAGYIAELVAEYMLGTPLDSGTSAWMERGTEMEAEARAWYSMDHDVDVREVGFITTDDGRVGCSPDGLTDGGGLEIKCYSARHHMECLLGQDITTGGQVQGSLWITGLPYWDVIAYSPSLPPVVTRVWPDPDYQAALSKHMPTFLAELEAAKVTVALLGAKGRRVTGDTALERLDARLQHDPPSPDDFGDPLTLQEVEEMRDALYVAVQRRAISQDTADMACAYGLRGMATVCRRMVGEAVAAMEAGTVVEVAR